MSEHVSAHVWALEHIGSPPAVPLKQRSAEAPPHTHILAPAGAQAGAGLGSKATWACPDSGSRPWEPPSLGRFSGSCRTPEQASDICSPDVHKWWGLDP